MLRFVVVVLAAVVLSVAGVLGWGYLDPPTPDGTPDWYGKVEAVAPAGGEPGWVLITLKTHPTEAGKPVDPDRATFKEVRADFTADTPVRRRTGKKGEPAEVRVGQTVSVWCDGPFTERAPPTRPAGFIVIEG